MTKDSISPFPTFKRAGEGRRSPMARKATLLFGAMLTIMAGATIAPAMPSIEAHFSAAENAELLSRLLLTLPALFVAVFAPVAGSLADRFGRRRLLLASIVLYGLAGTSGLFLDTLTGLLIGRGLLGVAVAGTMTAVTALAGDYFAGRERERYMGLQMAFTGFGGLLFLTGGGLLADLHWRGPFAIYAAAFALLPAVLFFLHEPERPTPANTQSAVETGSTRAGNPLHSIAVLFAVAFCNSVLFFLVPTQLPYFLQTLDIMEPSQAGLAVGLLTLTQALSSLAYGKLRGVMGLAGIFAAGFALMAIGFMLISVAATFMEIVLGTAVAGVGMGLVMPNFMTGAMALAPPHLRGRIAGGISTSLFTGQFISPIVSQPWIAQFGYATAFRDAGIALAVMAGAGALVALATQRRSKSTPN